MYESESLYASKKIQKFSDYLSIYKRCSIGHLYVMPHRATEVDPALPDSLETGSSITL